MANDMDCDGILTADDCDDNNPASNPMADDMDCDGVVSSMDCDDIDPTIVGAMGSDSTCPMDNHKRFYRVGIPPVMDNIGFWLASPLKCTAT